MNDIQAYYNFLDHKGETEIRVIDLKKEKILSIDFVDNEKKFIDVCTKWNGKGNVYAGINERKKGGRKREDVLSVKIIPLDIDAPHPKELPAAENEMQKAKVVVEKIYNDFVRGGFKKPMIVMSGNGYQILWKIPKIEITDKNRDIIEKKIHNFIKEMKKKYEENEVKIDQIGDLPRILKIPGTKSIKGEPTDERPHRIAKIIETPEPELCYKMRDKILMTETEERQKDSTGNEGVDIKKLKFFKNIDEKLKKLYENKITEKYRSRSEAEQALVNKLVFYGFNREQISEIMKSCKIGKWQEKGDSYRELTIRKAFECVDQRFEMENDLYFLDENGKPIPLNISRDILNKYNIITLRDNEEMFFYNGGIYHKNSETKIKEEAQKRVNNVSRNYKKEIIELIRGMTYIDREEITKNKHLLHLENGIYNLNTGELEDFSPEKISITQMPLKYDPKADCPKIKQFIREILGEDQTKLVQEFFGYCLMKDYKFNKAFMCFGTGRNGKTTFLNLLTKFLGEDNISIVSLQDLLYNRFAKQKLYGKLANVYDDLPNSKLSSTGNFKILTGKGRIWADVKFQDGFEFKNYAKLIFSCNELPKTEDTTYAFFRRWALLKFKNVFEGENEDPDMEEKITTEQELSGLFNWAITGLKRLLKNGGFTETQTAKALKSEWITRTDPLRAFVEKYVEIDSESYVTKDEFARKVNEFCQDCNVGELTKQYIGQNLPAVIPQVGQKKIKIDGNLTRVWNGLLIISENQKNEKKLEVQKKNEKKQENIGKYTDSQPFHILSNIKNNYKNNIYNTGLNILDFPYIRILDLLPKSDMISTDLLIDRVVLKFDLDMEKHRDVVESKIKKLKNDGLVFEPRPGFLKRL